MKQCDCGGDLIPCEEGSTLHACAICGTAWHIISEHEQALIDACKLPEIRAVVLAARRWSAAELARPEFEDVDGDENFFRLQAEDEYAAVLAPFQKLIPEE